MYHDHEIDLEDEVRNAAYFTGCCTICGHRLPLAALMDMCPECLESEEAAWCEEMDASEPDASELYASWSEEPFIEKATLYYREGILRLLTSAPHVIDFSFIKTRAGLAIARALSDAATCKETIRDYNGALIETLYFEEED